MTSQRSMLGSFSAVANAGHAISGGGGGHFHMHTCAPMGSQRIIPGAPFQRLNGAKARIKIDSARESGHGPLRPVLCRASLVLCLRLYHTCLWYTAPLLLCRQLFSVILSFRCHKVFPATKRSRGGTMSFPWAPRPGARTMSSHKARLAARQGTALDRLQNRTALLLGVI